MKPAALPESAAPSARRLAITVVSALAIAAIVVVAFVLPAEYGVDPLGTGGLLGLTSMSAPEMNVAPLPPASERLTPAVEGPVARYAQGYKVDAVRLEIGPYEYVEYKYRLESGASLTYSWSADAELIHELHADPDGTPAPEPVSFDARNRRADSGVLTAPFSGIHGWYWENPGADRVVVSLVSAGFYSSAVEMRSNRSRRTHDLQAPPLPPGPVAE
jgi:hypothetical protein